MKKIALAAVAGGLAAAILGLGSPAHAAPHTTAGIDHLDWLDDIHPKENIPNTDTNVKHHEIVLPLGPV